MPSTVAKVFSLSNHGSNLRLAVHVVTVVLCNNIYTNIKKQIQKYISCFFIISTTKILKEIEMSIYFGYL